jgi:alpha-mannosidase
VPFSGDFISADIKSISRRYRVPVLAVQGVEDLHEWGGTGLLEKQSSQTCISAVKKHDERDTLVIRLYNLTAREIEETLQFGTPLRTAWLANALEERVTQLPVAGGLELPLTLGPHEIITIDVELEISSPTS